jgi:hypothetical protein
MLQQCAQLYTRPSNQIFYYDAARASRRRKKNLFDAQGPKPENTTICDAKRSSDTEIKFELTHF